MIIILLSLNEVCVEIASFFIKYGHVGLFIYSFLETVASVPPIEVVQVPLTLLRPDRWIEYAINISLSCLLGAMVGYELGKKYGESILTRFGVKVKTIEKVKDYINKYDVLAMAIFSFTPIPFTIGVFVAGIVKMNKIKYFFTVLFARSIRYFIVGYICVYTSSHNVNGMYVSLILLIIGIVFVCMYYLYTWINKKRKL